MDIMCNFLFRLFGHSARVWDVRLLTSGHVVSVGEDSTCIVWNAQGQVVQKLKGHRVCIVSSLIYNVSYLFARMFVVCTFVYHVA